MSMWTHCNGAMCVIGTKEALAAVDQLIGKELMFDSSIEEWHYAVEHRDEYMPFGSEGSIHCGKTRKMKPVYCEYATEQHYKKVYIFKGSLRDYAYEQNVMHWFMELLYSIWSKAGATVKEARFEAEGLDICKMSYKAEADIYTDEKHTNND